MVLLHRPVTDEEIEDARVAREEQEALAKRALSLAMRGTRRNLTPYQRIRNASLRGTGVTLSADEVINVMGDNAIEKVAYDDDMAMVDPEFEPD